MLQHRNKQGLCAFWIDGRKVPFQIDDTAIHHLYSSSLVRTCSSFHTSFCMLVPCILVTATRPMSVTPRCSTLFSISLLFHWRSSICFHKIKLDDISVRECCQRKAGSLARFAKGAGYGYLAAVLNGPSVSHSMRLQPERPTLLIVPPAVLNRLLLAGLRDSLHCSPE